MTKAERMFLRAIELNPNYATAHHWYSGLLATMGRVDEARQFAERARALDPLSPAINLNLGGILEILGRFAEAEVLFLVGGGILWLYERASDTPSTVAASTSSATTNAATPGPLAPDEKSIAVLPFVDMSRGRALAIAASP